MQKTREWKEKIYNPIQSIHQPYQSPSPVPNRELVVNPIPSKPDQIHSEPKSKVSPASRVHTPGQAPKNPSVIILQKQKKTDVKKEV